MKIVVFILHSKYVSYSFQYLYNTYLQIDHLDAVLQNKRIHNSVWRRSH